MCEKNLNKKYFFFNKKEISFEEEKTRYKQINIFHHQTANPPNIRLDENVLKTSWRRLSSSSSADVFKTSSGRLDQDQYIRLGYTSSTQLAKLRYKDVIIT